MIPGYCLVCAQEISRPVRVVTIYEEFPFYTVGSMQGEPGTWKIFSDAWKRYRCRLYYVTRQDAHQRFSLQVARESLVSPKPAFVEVDVSGKNKDNVDNLILEYQRLNKIRLDKDAKPITQKWCEIPNLYGQLKQYAKGYTVDEQTLPAVQALRALIAGLERTPYRRPVPAAQPQPSYY